MLTLTKKQLLEVVSGQSLADTQEKVSFAGVEYDSREIKGGDLFIALPGAKVDGHQFVRQAYDRGASLIMIKNKEALKDIPEKHRVVVVSDTLEAFKKLASWWRREINIPVLAVTGSAGKTTIKELAASIAVQKSRGVYSLKSHNSSIGLPYSICRMGREHNWAVLEIGISRPEEMLELSKLAAPTAAVISCVAPAHTESFGSLEEIARAKLDIRHGLLEGGDLILNRDDKVLMVEAGKLNLEAAKYFGYSGECDCRIISAGHNSLEKLSVSLEIHGEEIMADVSLPGKHNAVNIAAAVLGVKTIMPDISNEEIKQGLELFRAPYMRMNIRKLESGQVIVDDAYNANPASMLAALEYMKDLKSGGKKIGFVLGDMLELGSFAEDYHKQVASVAAGIRPEFIIACGEYARVFFERATTNGVPAFVVESPEAAGHTAKKLKFDVLLVKASRAVGLDRTVAVLTGE
ncbi:MAG: UDP-N-acetylmuramoyl-tripeptide--D-alanyl-D-alanine ligase [Candidatus Dadabacteria bacterium]|nr:MAG: UDP-N-acetylmuramoyl-tripeptide--D-alanyl-D-alanine ligase [Candidatus Dadabacteria bacterium]